MSAIRAVEFRKRNFLKSLLVLKTERLCARYRTGAFYLQEYCRTSRGRIEVSSELGQGSTFALYLPYQEIPVEVAERSLSTKIDSESVRHKKILVVEDIESNFAQLNILLKKEYTILWVRNGQEAINSFIRENRT